MYMYTCMCVCACLHCWFKSYRCIYIYIYINTYNYNIITQPTYDAENSSFKEEIRRLDPRTHCGDLYELEVPGLITIRIIILTVISIIITVS